MTSPEAPTACQPATAGTDLGIEDFAYLPAEVTVSVGTTVVWANQGPSEHTVTADDGSFDSGSIAAGSSFAHTFDTAGSFRYRCTIHPEMVATVTVE
jgi:plastocyanin